MNFNESVTKKNIARAFAGVCQDGARYQFIAKSAIQEGYNYIAEQLKKIAKNKMAHASVLYSIMLDNIEDNKDNVNIEAGYPFEAQILKTSLQDSAEIEENEGKNIFSHFAKIALDEGFIDIQKKLELICEVNLKNAQTLKELAQKFDNNSLYEGSKSCCWVCSNCGHSEEKKSAWQKCPLCSYPQGYVIIPKEL